MKIRISGFLLQEANRIRWKKNRNRETLGRSSVQPCEAFFRAAFCYERTLTAAVRHMNLNIRI